VIALGSTTNFFGLAGLEHRALTIKSLRDAIYLRNHLIELLEQADFECMAANILGANFSGFVAWFLWRTIYLSKLPRSEKKLRVALDWTLDLLFSTDIVSFLDHRG
jgi:NADH dehydrogenase FAD-containing subunit